MIRKKGTAFKIVNMTIDFFLVLFSYYAAFTLRHDVLGGAITIDPREGAYLHLALIYAATVVVLYYVMHLYELQRTKKIGGSFTRILLANTFGVVALMATLYVGKVIHVSRMAMMFIWLLETLLVTARCEAFRQILSFLNQRGKFQKHYIIVGNGHLAQQYLQDIQREPYQGIVIDGYVSKVQKPEMGKCLGCYEDLAEIVADGQYDGLVVALEPHEVHFMKYVMETAGKEGLYLQMIPFFNDYYPAYPTIDLIGKTKLINLRATPLENVGNALVKRFIDVVGSAALIIATSPIMLAVAIGVKLSGPGPVIFCQERVGKNKKPFTMHKFRSMNANIDHDGWTTKNDARRTPFGAFIRKYSLDELPQLFDVLVGNMSLVGPRPELPRYVRQFKEDVPLYLVRQQVRPGMTGWAQIHGLRGDTSIEKRVAYDIWYIENWSLTLDIQILLKTAFGGIKNEE